MSIAVKQSQQLFNNPNRQLQQQRARTFAYSQQQWNRQKSIDFQVESQEEHVINKTIKHKHFLRQTPVAATETEVKPENKNNTLQSHEIEKVVIAAEQGNTENKDYQIYQNGKVSEFFQNKMLENPKTISDICLVNDHYILVKMPNQEINPENHNNLTETFTLQKELRAVKEQNDAIQSKKNPKKLCRYLKSKRNRITKIAPIHEEPEELSADEDKTQSKLYCLQMQSCWQANDQEVETFQTQTKIHRTIQNSGREGQNNVHKCVEEKLKKPPDIQTISGSLFKSSLQYQVSLQKHGSLLEIQNNNNSNNFELITSPSRRKCPRLERFYWLFHPFRGR